MGWSSCVMAVEVASTNGNSTVTVFPLTVGSDSRSM